MAPPPSPEAPPLTAELAEQPYLTRERQQADEGSDSGGAEVIAGATLRMRLEALAAAATHSEVIPGTVPLRPHGFVGNDQHDSADGRVVHKGACGEALAVARQMRRTPELQDQPSRKARKRETFMMKRFLKFLQGYWLELLDKEERKGSRLPRMETPEDKVSKIIVVFTSGNLSMAVAQMTTFGVAPTREATDSTITGMLKPNDDELPQGTHSQPHHL